MLGVGPELMLKALYDIDDDVNFLWCDHFTSLAIAAKRNEFKLIKIDHHRAMINEHKYIDFIDADHNDDHSAAISLKYALDLAKKKLIHALITGPVTKSCLLHLDPNTSYAGQTEYLARHLGNGAKVMMSFSGGPFVLNLYSTHHPLANVPNLLTKEGLKDHIISLAHHLSGLLGKKDKNINITVLGLNPHAGEGGILGLEEINIMIPVINDLKDQGYQVMGPVASDGFFAYLHEMKSYPDVVLAMYHDQGLAPYKLLAQGKAVNFTMGLSLPRTSPAHGTAFDLMGKHKASSLSSYEAIKLAITILKQSKLQSAP
jgi:4-hydroxythreonine-4-phosphate dehydrogenase